MSSIHGVFSQDEYRALGNIQKQFVANELVKNLTADEIKQVNHFKAVNKGGWRAQPRTDVALQQVGLEAPDREALSRKVLSGMIASKLTRNGTLQKAGVTTALGYNFYDLRAPVYLQYPVNTPFRNQIARESAVNAGVGQAAHWKGTKNPGVMPISIPEGMRAPIGTPDEVDYTSTYKELGGDRSVTFTGQFAGEGYTDNLADEHLRGLHSLWLGEEGMIINGNGGTAAGGNGLALGTPATPTLAQSTVTGGTFTNEKVTVAVVMITGMGAPLTNQFGYGVSHTVAGGLIPSYTAKSAAGESFFMPGGTSHVSALSASTTVSGGNNTVTATVVNKPGAAQFAWFVSTNGTPTLANSFLHSITTVPTVVIQAAATGTQTADAVGATSGTGLNSDQSFNSLEFTGLIPMVAALAGSWAVGNNWTDLKGATLTAAGHGVVNEVETILENCFINNQTGYTDIYGSPDAILSLSNTIMASASNNAFRFTYTKDQQGNITGGNAVSGYVSRYAVDAPGGANVIPLRMHPMMPAGTLYFHIGTNPYRHSRIGNVLAMLVQRDYYGIEWPVTTRSWTWGTYVQCVLAHRLPWIPAVLTGIGKS